MKKKLHWFVFSLLITVLLFNHSFAHGKNLNKLIPTALKHMIMNDQEIDYSLAKANPAEFINKIIKYSSENNCESIEAILSTQMLESYKHYWENSAWVNNSMEKMSYDANFNLVEVLFMVWVTNAYVNEGRWVNTYDNNENNTLWLQQVWQNNAWVNETRWMRTFDGNGNELTSEWQMWENNAWEGFMRWESTYDGSGKITFLLQQMWNSTAYEDFQRTTYSYNGSNQVAQTVTEMFAGIWMNQSRYTYTYDGNGNNTVMLSESWSFIGNVWENNFRTTNIFNGNNLITETLDESWNGSGWENQFKEMSEYTGMLRMVFTMQRWISSAWTNMSKTFATYDGQDRLIEDLHQVWFSNAWENSYRWTYVWGEPVTDVNDDLLSVSEFELAQNYPNPFNPSTKIEFRIQNLEHISLKIFDVLGNEITELINETKTPGNYVVEYNSSQLTSGIYFYELKSKSFSQMKKMVLIK